MNKIIAIGASNSRKSINRQFALWAAKEVNQAKVEMLDLNDFEMPIYSIDQENKYGIPKKAHEFKSRIKGADGIVLSLAEHNGSYTAAYKSVSDWVSRIEKGTWAGKPMLLLATSPGARGGQSVLNAAKMTIPYQGAQVSGIFSLPSFRNNFDSDKGIIDSSLRKDFFHQLEIFTEAIDNSGNPSNEPK